MTSSDSLIDQITCREEGFTLSSFGRKKTSRNSTHPTILRTRFRNDGIENFVDVIVKRHGLAVDLTFGDDG